MPMFTVQLNRPTDDKLKLEQ